jgi:maltose phosphorylase
VPPLKASVTRTEHEEGWYNRSFLETTTKRHRNSRKYSPFSFYRLDEIGVINYEITPLNKDTKIIYKPYIDAGVTRYKLG